MAVENNHQKNQKNAGSGMKGEADNFCKFTGNFSLKCWGKNRYAECS